jgi:hypothetical protein
VIEEDRLIAGLTGPSPVAALPMVLASWRGRVRPADRAGRGTQALVEMERGLMFVMAIRRSETC